MKLKTVNTPEDLHRELKLTATLYGSNITKLVAQSIQYALMHKDKVWGFTKKDEVLNEKRMDGVVGH